MAGKNAAVGLDLNEPFVEDVSMLDDLDEEPCSNNKPTSRAEGSKNSEQSNTAANANPEHSKHVNPEQSNIGASGDMEATTGQTLSSDDSAGDDEEVQSTPCSQTEIQTPFPGMKFDTWEEAKMHYNKYAHKIGFPIKCSTSKNSTRDGQKDKQLFVCNKNGKNEDINQLEAPLVRQRNRTSTKKTDCKARLRVKRKGQKWHVTYFIEEHNHNLIRKFSLKKYLRSHKGIPKEENDFVRMLHKVNLSAGRILRILGEVYGGLANVPYDNKDVSNFMAAIDEEHKHKDMSILLAHFAKVKKEDLDFYFNLHTDHADKVDRIFWVDGAAIAAYKNYSDCLSFDSTYMTNEYNMPLAPFIGINWWDIMQNAQAVLGNFLSKHEDLRQELNEVIDYSMSIEEFEMRWAEMILKHKVSDNTHLSDLYHLRATFVPPYFKERFFPFLQTTDRSEGFNVVSKRYISPHNGLHNFFEQYLKLQEKIDVAEDSVEFKDEDDIFRLWGDYPLEQQALDLYTHPIYLRFRAELWKVMSYNVQHVDGQNYDVMSIKPYVYGYGKNRYMVEANKETETYNCECCKFSRDGKALTDKYMLALEKDLLAMKASESAKRKNKKKTNATEDEAPDVANVGDSGQGSSTKFDHVEDPEMYNRWSSKEDMICT
ncbi:protein FAR1-RELATED SEQUENCE 5-like [Lolium perenne]|uniref:protein FAR1-RELATED SEQUENCE 5-like n=1 Tax=Lolium perenne TaxID=4522 RepID=UPI0021F5C3F8|nr:protein FAR1-RELATED SEQUENCE 3-like [Lolium perenne]